MNSKSLFLSLALFFSILSCAKKVQTASDKPQPKQTEIVNTKSNGKPLDNSVAGNKSQPKELANCIDISRRRPEIACPDGTNQVCGCNGKTYKNSCEADREGVTSFVPGKCYPVSDR